MSNSQVTKNTDDTKMYCEYCNNFVRHYVKFAKYHYHEIDHGHCVKPRIKNRRVSDKACEHWEEKRNK